MASHEAPDVTNASVVTLCPTPRSAPLTMGSPACAATELLILAINEYDAANVDPAYPVLDSCAIAFMLDWDCGARTFRKVEAPLPRRDPLVVSVRWLDGSSPFRPPSS